MSNGMDQRKGFSQEFGRMKVVQLFLETNDARLRGTRLKKMRLLSASC